MNKLTSLLPNGVLSVRRIIINGSNLIKYKTRLESQDLATHILKRSFASSGVNMSTEQPKTNPEAGQDVILESVNGKGIITLNKPKSLNALNLSMIRKIYPVLKAWESSQKLVIIKGTGGKAFCAGGDVLAMTEAAKAKNTKLYRDFFREEYQLNALIGTLHIPYIALINGITMGGGVGLSVHGKYRVATENTVFAMPETAIGLFTDVGGTYFLPRLGGKLGLYLALSGNRLKGEDVFKSGVATHVCSASMLPSLEQDLISLDSSSTKPKDIEQVLKKYHDQCPLSKKEFSLESKLPIINTAFKGQTVEEIISNLKADTIDPKWSKALAENMLKMSPTSMKITLQGMEMGGQSELQEALRIEYRLALRCCENHDFIEGVRARLVDKDQNPQWNPKTLEEVTPQIIDSYFAPVEGDLNL